MTALRLTALLALAACSMEAPNKPVEQVEVCESIATDLDSHLALRTGRTLEGLRTDAYAMADSEIARELFLLEQAFDAMDVGDDLGRLFSALRDEFLRGELDRLDLVHELGALIEALPGELRIEGRPELVPHLECGRVYALVSAPQHNA